MTILAPSLQLQSLSCCRFSLPLEFNSPFWFSLRKSQIFWEVSLRSWSWSQQVSAALSCRQTNLAILPARTLCSSVRTTSGLLLLLRMVSSSLGPTAGLVFLSSWLCPKLLMLFKPLMSVLLLWLLTKALRFYLPSYFEYFLTMLCQAGLPSSESLSSSSTDSLLTSPAALLLLPKYSLRNLKQSSQLMSPSRSASMEAKTSSSWSVGGLTPMNWRAYSMVKMNSFWFMILCCPRWQVFFLWSLWMAISPKCCSMQKLTSQSYSMTPSLLQSYRKTFFTKQCTSESFSCSTSIRKVLISSSWNWKSLFASNAISFLYITSRTEKARSQFRNQKRWMRPRGAEGCGSDDFSGSIEMGVIIIS